MAPGRHVEVEPALPELRPVALISDAPVHRVDEDDRAALVVGPRPAEVALALGRTVVDRDEEATAGRLPRERDEPIPRRVAVPCRLSFPEAPLAVARLRPSQTREQPAVERL